MRRLVHNEVRLHGAHLVVDTYGDERWASDVTVGRYGSQKGRVVPADEVDEPSRSDLRRGRVRERKRRLDEPITGPPKDYLPIP